MNTLLLAPLRLEARALRRGAPTAPIDRIGMGPARATAARARLGGAHEPGRPLLLAGIAGGLDPDLQPGELLVADSLVLADGKEVLELGGADELAQRLQAAGCTARVGRLVSSPAIVHGAPARARLAASGATAVDMEAWWCAGLAERYPFAVVRAICDVPGKELRSTSTLFTARRAYRALLAAAPVLADWSPVPARPLHPLGET